MNYRHAYHAGNFADVQKHIVLLALLQRLTAKPAPFLYLDTHAGRGVYELGSLEAERGGEWRNGIGRLQHADDLANPLLQQFRDLTRGEFEAGRYLGSPLFALRQLREQDRAVLVDQQPVEANALRAEIGRARHASVLTGDGYAAVKAHLPPKEKRCLVLIDPPYEDAREFEHLQTALTTALARWPQAVVAVWYPIKAGLAVSRWFKALEGAGLRKLLIAELAVRARDTALGLNGSGVLIANPPWQLDETLDAAHDDLLARLRVRPGAGDYRVEWLVGE